MVRIRWMSQRIHERLELEKGEKSHHLNCIESQDLRCQTRIISIGIEYEEVYERRIYSSLIPSCPRLVAHVFELLIYYYYSTLR